MSLEHRGRRRRRQPLMPQPALAWLIIGGCLDAGICYTTMQRSLVPDVPGVPCMIIYLRWRGGEHASPAVVMDHWVEALLRN